MHYCTTNGDVLCTCINLYIFALLKWVMKYIFFKRIKSFLLVIYCLYAQHWYYNFSLTWVRRHFVSECDIKRFQVIYTLVNTLWCIYTVLQQWIDKFVGKFMNVPVKLLQLYLKIICKTAIKMKLTRIPHIKKKSQYGLTVFQHPFSIRTMLWVSLWTKYELVLQNV